MSGRKRSSGKKRVGLQSSSSGNSEQLKFHERRHTDNMMCGLNKLRLKREFCDFIIKVQHEEICCHKAVLVLNSDYFQAMFSAGMSESSEGKLCLDNMDAAALKILVDYMYTGKLDVCQDKVQDVLIIADMLQMEPLKQVCATFIQQKIHFSNCLDLYQLGVQLCCDEIVARCCQLIKQRFVLLVKEQKLSILPYDIINCIIAWQDLALEPQGESCVLDAVLQWSMYDVNARHALFPALLAHVRASQLSDDIINNLKDHALLQHNTVLAENVAEWLKKEDSGRRVSGHTLYVVGGYLQSRTGPHCPRHKSAIQLVAGEWRHVCDLPIAGSGVMTLTAHGRLISFLYEWKQHELQTQHNVEQYRAVMEYDPQQDSWNDISSMFCHEAMDMMYECLTSAGSSTFCQHTNHLYLMSRSEVHIFSIDQCEGDLNVLATSHRVFATPADIQAINFGDFGLVSNRGKLWCIGGNNIKAKFEVEAVSSVWAMDIEEGTWTQMQNMAEKRARMAVVEKDGLIYAIGGYNGFRLASAEVYDAESNSWRSIASMQKHRTHFSACVYDDKIYVMGGKSYNFNNQLSGFGPRKVLKFTEIYDPETDSWSAGPLLPEARCMYGAAVL